MVPKILWSDGTAILRSLLFMLMVGSVAGFIESAAWAQTCLTDPRVSLSVKDTPLVDVLTQISRDTDCDIVIDPTWRNFPVTAQFENTPLPVAIKRVLKRLNHAIIYSLQNRVEILIYKSPNQGAQIQPPQPSTSPSSSPPLMPQRTPQPDVLQTPFIEPNDALNNAPPPDVESRLPKPPGQLPHPPAAKRKGGAYTPHPEAEQVIPPFHPDDRQDQR
jgi:hypothetical protein